MYDPISIETALVSAGGDLLIQLTDGNIINAGRVRGDTGPQGERGYMGPEGERGTDGTNGARWHTGVGAHDINDGEDGDLYMDVASSLLPIYQKINRSWLFLANLKATPTGSSGGGGNGSTSSGEAERPVIISPDFNNPNNPGTPPLFHPDFSGPDANLINGDLWIDGNGALYFYFNGTWNKFAVYSDQVLPAEDAPFTITTPNGETFRNQKEYNEWLYTRTDRRPIISSNPPTIHPDFPAYPLREGDFWIDDNDRLYYWDGTAWMPIQGGGGRNPIFDANPPVEHPDYVAPDNDLEVGDIWYDTDDNFKQYIWDGNQWVAISPDRTEAFTRIYTAVDPATYNSGNNATCALTGGATIDTITNIKLAGTDQLGKVRYAYAAGQSIVIEDERNGAYAVLSVTTVNALGDYDVVLIASNGTGNLTLGQPYSFGELTDSKVNISDTPPTPALEGDLWWNSADDELTLYVYYGTNWVPAAPPVSLDGINATIATALEIQEQILARVDAGEAIQTTVREDILTLQQELDALENTRYVGTWNAIDDSSKNGRPPGDGNFYFNTGDLATSWDLVAWIYIADVDSNGVTFTHSDIQVGDQLEVISKAENSYGIYTIESVQDAGDYIAIKIETMNRSDGIPATGAHLIKVFSIDTGIDLNEADERYMKLRGNQQLDKDVTFRLRQEDSADANKTFIAINDGEMNLYHVADPGAETHAANQKYVDEQVDTRLPLTGGNMTGGITTTETTFNDDELVTKAYVDTEIGGLVIPDSETLVTTNTAQTIAQAAKKTVLSEFIFNRDQGKTAVRFFLNNEQAAQIYYDSATTTRLQVEEGYEFKMVTTPVGGDAQQVLKTYTDGGIRIEKLRTPQQDHHAATKAYVDSMLAAPARLSWKWNSTSSGDSAPPTGCFKYTTNGSDHYYRFSLETAQGVKLGESIISEFNRSIDNGPVGTIWYKESDGWKFKQEFRINTFRWNFNNHFEFRVTSRSGSTSFTPGTPYHITVGGFF
jgi:hypothetical protein